MLKKYTDLGLKFKENELNYRDGFCHLTILIDEDYSLKCQGDTKTNYLYGFELHKNNFNKCIYLSNINCSDIYQIVSFVRNFDLYKVFFDNQFKRLNYLCDLRDKLEKYISMESYLKEI